MKEKLKKIIEFIKLIGIIILVLVFTAFIFWLDNIRFVY